MRAVVNRRYGGPEVVELADMPDPIPRAGDIVVRVEATDLTAADAALRSGSPFAARLFAGLTRPRLAVLGADFAGTVAAVGDGVTRFSVGDAVWGATGAAMGAHAELVVVPQEGAVALRPASLTATEAASLVDATALAFLRDTAALKAGERILINGASGAVGTAAVQLAVDMGAEVTAVCSAERLDLVRELGASHAFDYRAVDVTALPERFDVVFDVVGNMGYRRACRILTPTGRYLITVPTAGALGWHLLTLGSRGRRSRIAFTGLRKASVVRGDLEATGALVASGRIRAVVDEVYPFARGRDAHAHVARGKAGHVILTP
ncbi:NADPH2:quinone reductase [Microbacterium sp. cf046]|uniref:NAD(P)-dependent alcohol dehydrogenase n=1 Tax=Microbacterium sp. cf046 TaxID=1761803 RepID=UPI0008E48156|nr:NAD(P)-dependent alcohol dehydrogenase [Microbacterium sp. cf046]SFR90198.1 NADPH2:quinone reductase [Microbacterium sp. cf046]